MTACGTLLTNMQRHGFDPKQPIEYGKNGRLRDGAHRLACCLLLGVEAQRYQVATDGNATWGEDWFSRHGMAHEDLERIKADYEWLRNER